MASQSMPKGFLGAPAIKKTAGQSTPAVSTQINFPISAIQPRNPVNKQYPTVVNSLGALSVNVLGKKTPSVAISGIPVKASWFTLNNVSDWLGLATSFLDTNNNTSEYAILVADSLLNRVYDGCKCMTMSLYQTAPGGPILMDTSWLAIYGDSEKGTPTSFGAVTADTGNLRDVTNVTFTGAEDVANWRLTMMRAQGYQPTCDGTLYMASVESGMIGGTLQLTQNANAATVPSTSVTIAVGAAGAGISFALNLSKDEKQEDVIPNLLLQQNSWTLYATSGAYPMTLTAL